MKILLLELSTSDSCARLPSRYSGAGPTMRRLVENIDNCYIAAEKSCFENDANDKCILLHKEDIENIRNNQPLNPYLFGNDYDIVVYADPILVLNTQKPQICWAPGAYEKVHPEIKHLLVHNLKWQKPIVQNQNTKIHEFVLGIDIPKIFQEYQKSNYIFHCGNHYELVHSDMAANWCRNNKIKCLFAGPIDDSFRDKFLNEIDYEYTFYLNQITEEEKIKILKKARCCIDLVTHEINGPRLSCKQSWAYNTPVISTNFGIMPEVINRGKDGFIITNEKEFLEAYHQSQYINQKVCWDTSQAWSLDKMVDSFCKVINEVLNQKD